MTAEMVGQMSYPNGKGIAGQVGRNGIQPTNYLARNS